MYFDDIKLHTIVQLAPAVIEKEKMIAFAKDYDNIPLHTDEEYAKIQYIAYPMIAPSVFIQRSSMSVPRACGN